MLKGYIYNAYSEVLWLFYQKVERVGDNKYLTILFWIKNKYFYSLFLVLDIKHFFRKG